MKAEDETPRNVSSVFNMGTWSPAEDGRLKEAVAKHGTRWVIVAADVGTRNGDQCAKRWKENLNPELDHSPWSPWEDKLLLNLVEVYGNNWKFIASSFLEARAPLSLKNRHSLLMRRFKRQGASRRQQSALIESTSPTTSYPQVSEPFDITSGFDTEVAGSCSSSPLRGPRSDTEGNSTRSTSRVGSATDLTSFLGTANSTTDGSVGNHNFYTTPFGTFVPQSAQYSPDTAQMGWEAQYPWDHYLNSINTLDPVAKSSGTKSDGTADIVPDRATEGRQHQHQNQHQIQSLRDEADHDHPIAYSVSCRRGMLKAVAHHLVDAVISEASDKLKDDDQVTLTLRLRE